MPSKNENDSSQSISEVNSQINQQKYEADVQINEFLPKHKRLHECAKTNNIGFIKAPGYCYNREDINIQDALKNTALYYAAQHQYYHFCRFLLNNQADTNIICEDGNTALHVAFATSFDNNIDVIMLLIDNGGDMNIFNKEGQTPLAFASEKILKILGLENGITSESQKNYFFDNNLLFQQKQSERILKNINEQNYQGVFKFSHMRNYSQNLKIKIGKQVELQAFTKENKKQVKNQDTDKINQILNVKLQKSKQ